jgi:hypothetical protein
MAEGGGRHRRRAPSHRTYSRRFWHGHRHAVRFVISVSAGSASTCAASRAAAAVPDRVPRRPTETALYAIVRDHLEGFLSHAREAYDRSLPPYVEQAFRAYLECGVFAHGFMRFHCDGCRRDLLVAFSCQGRGVCPSCAGRRMANITSTGGEGQIAACRPEGVWTPYPRTNRTDPRMGMRCLVSVRRGVPGGALISGSSSNLGHRRLPARLDPAPLRLLRGARRGQCSALGRDVVDGRVAGPLPEEGRALPALGLVEPEAPPLHVVDSGLGALHVARRAREVSISDAAGVSIR